MSEREPIGNGKRKGSSEKGFREEKPVFKRILLKVSGESMLGKSPSTVDPDAIMKIADEIEENVKLNIDLALVLGGGNIFRGAKAQKMGFNRVTGDVMGMLSTVINAVALQDVLERKGITTRVMSAVEMSQVAEPMIRRRALRHLERGRVVIFAAGTGSPYFTTDTAAALRASEIGADVILKATKVDGIYSADPEKVKDPEKYDSISYIEFIDKGLSVMDTTAVSLCMENNIPIIVFDIQERGNLKRVILGEKIGSLVSGQ